MKKGFACLAAVCLLAGGAFAGDSSERGVPTAPLKIYSGGVGGGFMYALNDDFKGECGEAFGKVIFMNSFDFTENLTLFADVNWYIGDRGVGNFGVDLGGDFLFSSARVRPFVGAGVGVHYFDRVVIDNNGEEFDADFAQKFGASLTARVGVALELTETVQIRIRAPFHIIYNKTADMGVGVDVGVMFFSRLRGVKKLVY